MAETITLSPFEIDSSAGGYPSSDTLIFGSGYGHSNFVTPMARFYFYDALGAKQADKSPILFIRMGGTFQSGLTNGYSESANIFGTPNDKGAIAFGYNAVKGGADAVFKQLIGGGAGAASFIASAGQSGKAQYEFLTRKVLNTFQQLIYQGPTFRRFTLPFTMKPTSKAEAEIMLKIIKTFRVASSPKGAGDELSVQGVATGGVKQELTAEQQKAADDAAAKDAKLSTTDVGDLFGLVAGSTTFSFGYPDMCKFQIILQRVSGGTDTRLAEVFGSGYCVIENVQIDYGSQNKMVFFSPEGEKGGKYYPSEVNLSINLRETTLPTAGAITADHGNAERTIF